MDIQLFFFILFGAGAIASAIATVTSKNPVAGAMSLVAHFFMLAGLYLTLQAQFVAVVQVLVYAGAIMVLVVFVILLLNVGRERQSVERVGIRMVGSSVVGVIFIGLISFLLLSNPTNVNAISAQASEIGTTEAIGNSLFKTYLFPFEAVSLVLLAALIGAVVLAKRHLQKDTES